MVRGLFSSATGMIAQSRKIDVLGNNISNINTDGFKRDDVSLQSFDEVVASSLSEHVPLGSLSTGVKVGEVTTDFTQGPLEQTGRDTDMGITGQGFFAVEATPQGTSVKYTRNGNFSVDAEGYLALASGERLLGADGLPIMAGGDQFQVSNVGAVSENGQEIGNIALYAPQNAGDITKRTDGFFDISSPVLSGDTIKQGYLEGSNVDAVDDMTGMMQATRSFQACQQSFQVSSDTLDKLISQVGSLKA